MPASHVHDACESIYGLFFFVCQTVGRVQLASCVGRVLLQVSAYQPGGRAERSRWLLELACALAARAREAHP